MTPLRARAKTRWRPIAVRISLGALGFSVLVYLALWSTAQRNGTLIEGAVDPWRQLKSYPQYKLFDYRAGVATAKHVAGLPRGVAHLHLEIAPQHVRKLRIKQEQALRDGILVAEAGDEVPARLTVDGGEVLKINTRLKGDWVDHLAGSKYSLRVEVRGGKALFGMRRFSLQQDATRRSHAEGLLLRHMRAHDVLAPRYRYVFLTINSHVPGIMAIEEHVSKELLESQGRRESVVLALDEDPLWRQRRSNRATGTTPVAYAGELTKNVLNTTQFSASTLPLRAFQENRIWNTPSLRAFHQQALGLMRGYIEGSLDAELVFDMEILGRYLAILNVWNATHGLIFHNLRFYYNPVTRLFEPVAFDNNVPFDRPHDMPDAVRLGGFHGARSSQAFLDAYAATLDKLAAEVAGGELQRQIHQWDSEFRTALGSEYPWVRGYDTRQLMQRIEFLRAHIPARSGRFERYRPAVARRVAHPAALDSFAHAYWIDSSAGAYLEIHNAIQLPLHVEDLWFRPPGSDRHLETSLTGAERMIAPAGPAQQRRRIAVPVGPVAAGGNYRLRLQVAASSVARVLNARRYYPAFTRVPYRATDEAEFLARHGFVAVRDGEFVIGPGEWRIDRDLIVPPNRPLRLSAGATLRFAQGARLVLRSALRTDGTEENPVELGPAQESWGGLVVMGAGERSLLRGLRLSGVRTPEVDDWGLTGAATFHRSDVSIVASRFESCATEDALNIIGGHLSIVDTVFANHASDAIDIDFGRGVVADSRFTGIGGDALDISGSEIEARDLRMSSIGDKALSIGEQSRFAGERIVADGVQFGIVAKDGSVARLADSRFSDVRQAAFAAYIKKPEYAAAQLVLVDNRVSATAEIAVAVHPSSIMLNGSAVAPARQVGKRLAGTLQRFAATSAP